MNFQISTPRASFSSRYILPVVILSLIGATIILIATLRYGAGISNDSVSYIATARHIADGTGVISFDNNPLVEWPPLYPAILGAFDFAFGMDPLSSAPIINTVLFGLIIFLSGVLFFKSLNSATLAFLGTASLLVSVPLTYVSMQAWSEPLFIILVVLYLISTKSYLEKADKTSLILLSLSVALACLTRYIGVILILTGFVSIMFFRHGNVKAKIRHLVFFTIVSSLPIGIWVFRNFSISGTLFGGRHSSIITFSQNISDTFATILGWYLPGGIAASPACLIMMSAVTVIFLSAFLYTVFVKEKKVPTLQTHPFLRILFLLIAVYVSFLVISSTMTATDSIGNRLLSPIVVPVYLLGLIFMEKLFEPLRPLFSRKLAILLLATGVIVFFAIPFNGITGKITNHLNQGYVYSNTTWGNSETIRYLLMHQSLASGGVVYSNQPEALYILTNFGVRLSPRKNYFNSTQATNDLSTFIASLQPNGNYLVWFNGSLNYLYTPEELKSFVVLEQKAKLRDGIIYFVSKK
jgi:hypothetical protein